MRPSTTLGIHEALTPVAKHVAVPGRPSPHPTNTSVQGLEQAIIYQPFQGPLRRELMTAPPLTRAEKSSHGQADPKWALGDLMLEIPEHRMGSYAVDVSTPESELRRYRDVAERWPVEHRVAASWSAHRDLKDLPERFEVIRPGMTVRQAAEAAGKKPIDAKPVNRMSLRERADHVISVLSDKVVNDEVLAILQERKVARRVRRAAQRASDDRSAEYKDALRDLRQAQASKSPETAFLEVVFKIQEAAEYVRAVDAAVSVDDGTPSLVPANRIPDLIVAIDGLSQVVSSALARLSTPAGSDTSSDYIDVDVAEPRRELLD